MANSHKRETYARRKPKALLIAGPLAFVATATAVTLGVLHSDPDTRHLMASRDASTDISRSREVVSRSESRRAVVSAEKFHLHLQAAYDVRKTNEAIRNAHVRLWTTAPLNLWTTPGTDAKQVGVLDTGKRVLITGRKSDGRDELVVDGEARWVSAGYLTADKPEPAKSAPAATTARTATAGLSTAPCPDGSVESGLTSEAVLVYRAVCHAYPQITTYGGWDAHGEHASGKAIDIMTSDKALGDQIAAFLQSHASELDLYDVIWWDQIWTPERASEGWRDYGDHGSATANHMDHVHVSTNG